MKAKLKYLPILFLVIVTIWLRLTDLGYSDYQGDEIKALSLPETGQGLLNFLFLQRKGPFQFLVTYLVHFTNPTFSNQFLARLPFALAGILAIFFFYRFVELNFGKPVALLASLFLTLNGIFIGLNRIIQYQPFVILFSILTLYCFSLAIYRARWVVYGIYAGMFFWAVALLSHYDGLFIAPFALVLLVRWYLQSSSLTLAARLRHLAVAGGVAALLVAGFYLPMLLSVTADTQAYWSERFTETGGTQKISSSIVVFKVYNPLLAVYLYPLFGVLSLVKIKQVWPVLAWFLFPWIFLEVFIYSPGTHIYTYLLPATILVAFGAITLYEAITKMFSHRLAPWFSAAGLALIFVFLFSVSNFIFIDHTPEYPWQERRILWWKIGNLDTDYQLWTYGFPYSRRWKDIGHYITTHKINDFYATNEDKLIANYYVPYQFDIDQSGYYIEIQNPRNYHDVPAKDKIRYWIKKYKPVKVFEDNGVVVAKIYQMAVGDIDDIRQAGY